MRWLLLASLLAACGSDLDDRDAAVADLRPISVIDLCSVCVPDLGASYGAGCWALVGGASPARSPKRSIELESDYVACVESVCGGPDGDGGAGLPCAVGAQSVACARCMANVQSNNQLGSSIVDGGISACVDVDTGAADPNGLGCTNDVGACAVQLVACVLDCNSDKDCAELVHSDGTRSTCDLTMNQCN